MSLLISSAAKLCRLKALSPGHINAYSRLLSYSPTLNDDVQAHQRIQLLVEENKALKKRIELLAAHLMRYRSFQIIMAIIIIPCSALATIDILVHGL